MLLHMLVSVISDDKPGVVEALAESISEQNGNWLESRLSQLGGKFAGIIRVAIPTDKSDALAEALSQLEAKGIWVRCENVDTPASEEKDPSKTAKVHVIGPDRSGIVHELSRALVRNKINLAELETGLSSMPYSGEPLFEASGQLEIPSDSDVGELQETLDQIADSLAVDISLTLTDE